MGIMGIEVGTSISRLSSHAARIRAVVAPGGIVTELSLHVTSDALDARPK